MTTSRVTTAYLELQRAGLVGGEISFEQKMKLMQILRDLSGATTLATEADDLQALKATYDAAWDAILAFGTVTDGERADVVTATAALVAASAALQTAVGASLMVALKTAVDADNTKVDVLAALTGADTSAAFNAAIADIVTTEAAVTAAHAAAVTPLAGLELPSAAITQSSTDMA